VLGENLAIDVLGLLELAGMVMLSADREPLGQC